MKIQVFPLEVEGKKRIGIRPLGFDQAFPGLMKQIPGSRWTPGEECWHIPYTAEAYGELKRLLGKGRLLFYNNAHCIMPKRRTTLRRQIIQSSFTSTGQKIKSGERFPTHALTLEGNPPAGRHPLGIKGARWEA